MKVCLFIVTINLIITYSRRMTSVIFIFFHRESLYFQAFEGFKFQSFIFTLMRVKYKKDQGNYETRLGLSCNNFFL